MSFTEDKHHIECDCTEHAAEFVWTKYSDGGHDTMDISIWHKSRTSSVLSFKERIRWCWKILTTGLPWADEVVISADKAKELAEFINNGLATEEEFIKRIESVEASGMLKDVLMKHGTWMDEFRVTWRKYGRFENLPRHYKTAIFAAEQERRKAGRPKGY